MACLMAAFSVGTAMVSERVLCSRGWVLCSGRARGTRSPAPSPGHLPPGPRGGAVARVLGTQRSPCFLPRPSAPGRRRGRHPTSVPTAWTSSASDGGAWGPGTESAPGMAAAGAGGRPSFVPVCAAGAREPAFLAPPPGAPRTVWGNKRGSGSPRERASREQPLPDLLPSGWRGPGQADEGQAVFCSLARGGWGQGRPSSVSWGYQLRRGTTGCQRIHG